MNHYFEAKAGRVYLMLDTSSYGESLRDIEGSFSIGEARSLLKFLTGAIDAAEVQEHEELVRMLPEMKKEYDKLQTQLAALGERIGAVEKLSPGVLL